MLNIYNKTRFKLEEIFDLLLNQIISSNEKLTVISNSEDSILPTESILMKKILNERASGDFYSLGSEVNRNNMGDERIVLYLNKMTDKRHTADLTLIIEICRPFNIVHLHLKTHIQPLIALLEKRLNTPTQKDENMVVFSLPMNSSHDQNITFLNSIMMEINSFYYNLTDDNQLGIFQHYCCHFPGYDEFFSIVPTSKILSALWYKSFQDLNFLPQEVSKLILQFVIQGKLIDVYHQYKRDSIVNPDRSPQTVATIAGDDDSAVNKIDTQGNSGDVINNCVQWTANNLLAPSFLGTAIGVLSLLLSLPEEQFYTYLLTVLSTALVLLFIGKKFSSHSESTEMNSCIRTSVLSIATIASTKGIMFFNSQLINPSESMTECNEIDSELCAQPN